MPFHPEWKCWNQDSHIHFLQVSKCGDISQERKLFHFPIAEARQRPVLGDISSLRPCIYIFSGRLMAFETIWSQENHQSFLDIGGSGSHFKFGERNRVTCPRAGGSLLLSWTSLTKSGNKGIFWFLLALLTSMLEVKEKLRPVFNSYPPSFPTAITLWRVPVIELTPFLTIGQCWGHRLLVARTDDENGSWERNYREVARVAHKSKNVWEG